jgi:acyl-CoA synthetase (AMP-forming)/AMP-acid ligase II
MRKELKTVKKYICISEERLKENSLNALYYEELVEQNSAAEPDIEITEEDLHTLFYTSGTTGKPKGVMLTQKSWVNVAINILLNYGPITRNDIILNLQPLSHGAGFFVLPFFIQGATNVLVEFTPRLVFETIHKERVTVLKLVPIMLYRLMDAPEKEEYNLSSLTHIIYGGSPIDQPRLVEALRSFGQKLSQLYGQAEIPMCISTLSREDHVLKGSEEERKRLNSAGKPCINVEVKVVDEKGKELKSGEIGEVIAKGYHAMKGYWKLPEATVETLKNGWVYTGDLGYMDSKGFLFLVDRKKDLIISGAFNVYPAEVENVIITHPAVKEAVVIGVPDDTWGEAVKAIVVLKKGSDVTDQGIIKFCKDKGLEFISPKSIDFVEEIPRNPYGKIDKKTLREPYWKGYERAIH